MMSLASFVKNCSGRNPAPRAVRLQVEPLEDRLVPTVNLPSYVFNFPGVGTFHATNEQVSTNGIWVTATFSGVFADAKSGINVPVTGNLFGVGQPLTTDFISFHGSASKGIEAESVKFGGILNEGQQLDEIIPPSLQGVLTEDYTWFTSVNPQDDAHQTVTTNVSGAGTVGTGLSGAGQTGAGWIVLLAAPMSPASHHMVNLQPLPPG